MGNRKQPFGYRVVMGEIALHPQESKLVEYIFQQYLVGATYNTLVEELREQSIPYDEGKLWNKNMVARILEDSRYTGERGYPPVIDREALEKALEKRSAKQTAAPKTDTQKLLRRFSGRFSASFAWPPTAGYPPMTRNSSPAMSPSRTTTPTRS